MKPAYILRRIQHRHRRLPHHCVQLRLRSGIRYTVSRPRQHLHPPRPRILQQRSRPALCPRNHLRLHRYRHKDLRRHTHLQPCKPFRAHAHNRHRHAIQRNYLPHDCRRTPKPPRPVSIADHHHRRGARACVIGRLQHASYLRSYTERIESIPAHQLRRIQLGNSIHRRRDSRVGERNQLVKRIPLPTQRLQHRIRKRSAPQPAALHLAHIAPHRRNHLLMPAHPRQHPE
jgi:hypothetical protein